MSGIGSKYNKILADYDKHCQLLSEATAITAGETFAQQTARKRKLEADYIRWFEYYFPNYAGSKCAWFHKKMADLIIKNKNLRLLAELYRSAGKSVHIDMGIPLFLYLAMHDIKFMLLIGETEPKAKKLLSGIQAQLCYNKRIINDYGEKFLQGDWAEGDFTTTDGVKFMALGFGQSPRGAREQANRPDYIVVDDADSKKHVNNDRLMREAIDFITEDVWGCFDSSDTATARFIYSNNNFHKNSITNRLKNYFLQAIANSKDSNFKILTVCAVKDLETFEPEWKEKTSAEYWKKKYRETPHRSFMREYMHTHIADGTIFKNENILYTDPLPLSKYDALVLYGDLSYKAAGDYKAMLLVGKIGRQFHILYALVRRTSRPYCAEWLYNLYEDRKLEKYGIKYKIEGLFAMDDFVNDFDVEGDKRGYHIPVTADKKSKDNKYDRVEAMSAFFERHNIFFNAKEKNSPDFVIMIDQLLAFEKGSQANDDAPDALCDAIAELNKTTAIDKFPATTTSRMETLSRSKHRF